MLMSETYKYVGGLIVVDFAITSPCLLFCISLCSKTDPLEFAVKLTANGTEHDMTNTAFALIFGFVIAFGLPLNAVALWILLRHHYLKSPSAVFMVNLVISDLLLIISLPMRVYFYATDSWSFGVMTCICVTMLFRNNIRSSSVFITFISVDRLLAVVYPLRSRHLRSPSNAVKGAVFVWMIVVLVNIPESVEFSRYLDQTQNSTCFDFETPRNGSRAFEPGLAIDYFQLVLLFTMLAVNIVSTILVSWTLQRHLHESARVSNKVNVMLIFAMNLMMFIVFFLPVSLVVFFEDHRPVLSCLASVNCCLDPLLYYFSFDGFWKRKEDVNSS
ncbi:lysophosphatidic acid receptor 6-like [Cololabis saira]|uniref:lysophosphatidic acid receptor 6-like n=1 Tax=Cololabis saira TaxID=129043 RepID=UPI002AD4D7D5|nr:lysophosphatidic acid receptor 6-like [Cololabis saira]